MKISPSVLITAFCLFAVTNTFADDSTAIVNVNGVVITEDVLDLYAIKRLGVATGNGFPSDKKEELVEELISRELLVQDAKSMKMDKDPEIESQINEVVKNTLLQFRIDRLLEDQQPSEELLLTIYKDHIVDKSSGEYHARHILLKTREEAKEIIKQLNKGVTFAEMAKQHSIGPSKTQGGDLGWFALNQMVKPFSDAVEKLKPGKFTQRPVETRFGWHIIYLEASRKVEPPAYEVVQAQVLQIAQNKIISDYIESLKDKAEIVIPK